MKVDALHPLFGGEVHGVDLSEPPAPDLVAAIRALMDDLAVLVFRDQALDDAQHIALSRAFGPLELPPDYRSGVARRLRRELYDASNLDVEGKVLPADSPRREYNRANLRFHADSTFNDLPTTWSLLRAETVPDAGGNTEFIDTRIVYDDLPDATKSRIAPLRALHDFWHSHAEGKFFKVTDEMRRLMPPVEQDLVCVLPDGRRALCIGSHASGIVGMPAAEGRALLDELYEFATQPKYVYSHAWRAHDLIIWDNRRTLHRASPWQDEGRTRDLRRTTLLASGPEISATDRAGS